MRIGLVESLRVAAAGLGLLATVTSQPAYLAAQDLPRGFQTSLLYLGNHPDDKELGRRFEASQGIASDGEFWYFTTTRTLWKLPMSVDLSSDSEDIVAAIERETSISEMGLAPKYDHLGDLDSVEGVTDSRGNRVGILVIPVEGDGPGLLAFVRTENLALLGTVTVDPQWQGKSAPWAAAHDGKIYSAAFSGERIVDYRIVFDEDLNPRVVFTNAFGLLDQEGRLLVLRNFQGGDFSDDGTMFYAATGRERPRGNRGLHALVVERDVFRRTHKSTQSTRPFEFETHCCDEEPEGLVYIDLNDDRAPGIAGELHVILLNVDGGRNNDNIWLKHYTSFLRVRPQIPGRVGDGTPERPFGSIPLALENAWDGATLVLEKGDYRGVVRITEKARLVSRGGRVRIRP